MIPASSFKEFMKFDYLPSGSATRLIRGDRNLNLMTWWGRWDCKTVNQKEKKEKKKQDNKVCTHFSLCTWHLPHYQKYIDKAQNCFPNSYHPNRYAENFISNLTWFCTSFCFKRSRKVVFFCLKLMQHRNATSFQKMFVKYLLLFFFLVLVENVLGNPITAPKEVKVNERTMIDQEMLQCNNADFLLCDTAQIFDGNQSMGDDEILKIFFFRQSIIQIILYYSQNAIWDRI